MELQDTYQHCSQQCGSVSHAQSSHPSSS